jgi:hypothetical protein
MRIVVVWPHGSLFGKLAKFALNFTLVDLSRVFALHVACRLHDVLCFAPILQVWMHLDECRTIFEGALAHTPKPPVFDRNRVQTPMHTTFDTL